MRNTINNLFKRRIRGLGYLILNLWATRGMSKIPLKQDGDYYFGGLHSSQIPELDNLHRLLRYGNSLNTWTKILLKYRGYVLCGIVMDRDKKILGFHLSQFKKDEYAARIIRVEFAGLLPHIRGKGIAVLSRIHMVEYCLSQGIKGFSANVRSENVAALKSAEHLGYKLIEKPVDSKGKITMQWIFNE